MKHLSLPPRRRFPVVLRPSLLYHHLNSSSSGSSSSSGGSSSGSSGSRLRFGTSARSETPSQIGAIAGAEMDPSKGVKVEGQGQGEEQKERAEVGGGIEAGDYDSWSATQLMQRVRELEAALKRRDER